MQKRKRKHKKTVFTRTIVPAALILGCCALSFAAGYACHRQKPVPYELANNEQTAVDAEQTPVTQEMQSQSSDNFNAQNGGLNEQADNGPVLPETAVRKSGSGGSAGLLKDAVTLKGTLGIVYPLLSVYGPREDYGGQISSHHKGLDFAMDENTPLVSPSDVRIAHTGWNEVRGNWIVMYWGNGYYVEYQHLSEICVEEDDRVSAGTIVGYSGDTGASLMPHLHLEILQSYDGKDSITDFEDPAIRINPYFFVFGTEEVSVMSD